MSTKSPKSDKQYVWEAVADSSSYTIKEETNPENLLRRGTQITLYLRVHSPSCLFRTRECLLSVQTSNLWTFQEDDKYEFAEPTKIQSLVKNYSQFVAFPIYTWQEKSRSVEVTIRKFPYLFEEYTTGLILWADD